MFGYEQKGFLICEAVKDSLNKIPLDQRFLFFCHVINAIIFIMRMIMLLIMVIVIVIMTAQSTLLLVMLILAVYDLM